MINHKPKPPGFWISFLRWFCPPDLFEGIEGDVMEQFHQEAETLGDRKARRYFAWHVIRFFRPGILIRHQSSFSPRSLYNMIDLFIIYLRISWRNMMRYKSISAINIVGLAVSMSIGLLILSVIKNRLDFDTFHPHSDRLYRIKTLVTQLSGQVVHYASTPQPLGSSLSQNYPFVEEVLTITPFQGQAWIKGEEFNLKAAFADASFFNVFGFTLLSGDVGHALLEPYSIVLSEQTAIKFFGKQAALGETLTIHGYGDFKVTGILDKPDRPSQLEYEAYASQGNFTSAATSQSINENDDWKLYSASYTYVRIKEGTDECCALIQDGSSGAEVSLHAFSINRKLLRSWLVPISLLTQS